MAVNPYISIGDEDRRAMLKAVGVSQLDDLFKHIPVKPSAFDGSALNFDHGLSEWETSHHAQSMSHLNASTHDAFAFMGAGVYDHWYPSVVNYLVSRGEFLTAYTPYQPELSQGTLQLIYEFQSLLTRLTAMEVCNASVYDGAHALTEAVLMAIRIGKVQDKPFTIVLTQGLHPEYRLVLETYLRGFPNARCVSLPLDPQTGSTQWDAFVPGTDQPACVVVGQYPNFFGVLDTIDGLTAFAKKQHLISVLLNTEPYVFGIHEPPGTFGVDILAMELQSFGNAIAFGGPHIGAVLTRKEYIRQLPGRLVGKTKTIEGDREAYVLTLSTREQHIRREKATSNICTNQGLLAHRVVAHLCLLGNDGYRIIAEQNHRGAHLAYTLWSRYCAPLFPKGEFYNEFAFKLDDTLKTKIQKMKENKIYFGVRRDQIEAHLPAPKQDIGDYVLLSVTEKRLPTEIIKVTDFLN